MTTSTAMDAPSRAGVSLSVVWVLCALFLLLAICLVPTVSVESTGERGNESSDQ
jgi:hypothetical protein